MLFLLVMAIAVVTIALKNLYMPDLPQVRGQVMKEVLQSDKPTSELAKKYQGFRKFIDHKWKKGEGYRQEDSLSNQARSLANSDSLGIRAAFYVAWDAQAFFSLKRNIHKMNLVIPEWFFLDAKGDSVYTNIDKRGLAVIKASGVKVMPMLTNNINGVCARQVDLLMGMK